MMILIQLNDEDDAADDGDEDDYLSEVCPRCVMRKGSVGQPLLLRQSQRDQRRQRHTARDLLPVSVCVCARKKEASVWL